MSKRLPKKIRNTSPEKFEQWVHYLSNKLGIKRVPKFKDQSKPIVELSDREFLDFTVRMLEQAADTMCQICPILSREPEEEEPECLLFAVHAITDFFYFLKYVYRGRMPKRIPKDFWELYTRSFIASQKTEKS